MADPGALESGKPGKKKAKTEDGPSFSSRRRGEMICDGEAAEGDSAVEEGSMDPLVVFGSGIMMMILSKLDARSVALARLVSRGWLLLASSDKIWAPKEKKASCRCTGEMEAYYDLACGISLHRVLQIWFTLEGKEKNPLFNCLAPIRRFIP